MQFSEITKYNEIPLFTQITGIYTINLIVAFFLIFVLARFISNNFRWLLIICGPVFIPTILLLMGYTVYQDLSTNDNEYKLMLAQWVVHGLLYSTLRWITSVTVNDSTTTKTESHPVKVYIRGLFVGILCAFQTPMPSKHVVFVLRHVIKGFNIIGDFCRNKLGLGSSKKTVTE